MFVPPPPGSNGLTGKRNGQRQLDPPHALRPSPVPETEPPTSVRIVPAAVRVRRAAVSVASKNLFVPSCTPGRFGANGTDRMTGVSGMTCKRSRYDANRRARSRPARTLDIWRYIYIFIFHIDGGVAKTTRGQGVEELVAVGCGVRWNGGVCVCVVCTVCVVCGCGCRVGNA